MIDIISRTGRVWSGDATYAALAHGFLGAREFANPVESFELFFAINFILKIQFANIYNILSNWK